MRNIIFSEGEYYHVYNRGVEKRNLFVDQEDYERFLQSMTAFNTIEPIGSLYELSFVENNHLATRSPSEPLVEISAYCLNPNHFHILLKQIAENGVSQFMKRLGGGYSWYFNNKNRRSGTLFQGPFRAKHVATNEYLLRLSAYINLNDQVHSLGDQVAKYGKGVSSWEMYSTGGDVLDDGVLEKLPGVSCSKDIILGQFSSISEYKKFALETLALIREGKETAREIGRLSFD